ncbi:MAG: ethyl tert-butyl ether degradation protein EthD [Phycisphaeraceae bacterium]|nr:ethyl tert-butyl ether degradation protein EthD [Phycisphaeraceae bacterium]
MVKFVMCICRHPDMSRAQFQDYWLNQHAPLFQKLADTFKAKRYVQDHTIDTRLNDDIRASRGMAQEYDGVAEVWFESEAALIEAMSSPEGQKASALLAEDESKFIDHAGSTAFIAVEHVF